MVTDDLNTAVLLRHNAALMRPLLFGVRWLVALATLTACALACGDHPTQVVAGVKAQLVIQSQDGILRIGDKVFANLILPKASQLPTGTLARASCTSFQFTVEPASGWHDPWADWYYSGIPQHATGADSPYTCGVIAMPPGRLMPPPQINFTLNDWIEFDRPGKYRISVIYRARFRRPQDLLNDPYDDRQSAVYVTLATEPVEIEVLPESTDVVRRASEALLFLQSHFHDDDPAWGSSDSTPFPEWAEYSRSEAVIPLLAQFYEQSSNVARRGLITSPHRRLVVQEMERELVDRRHSVGLGFPEVLAFIAAELQHPELFSQRPQNWWSPAWEEASRTRNEVFLQLLSEYVRKLLLAIPHKDDGPQRDSLRVALLILARWHLPGQAQLRTQAADEAAQLLPKMKEAPILWEEQWKIIASPALLPYLRKTEQKGWLYELAPEEARQSMIHSAVRGDWATVTEWSTVMPENGRPSAVLDSHLAKALREEPDDEQLESNLRQILLQLGGPDLVMPARQILASESCMGRPALWAFLLKQEGALAEERLIRRYHRAITDPTCEADLSLQQIWLNHSVRYWSPQLEAVVVSQLDKTESLAIAAAHLLERFGSKDSEGPLWERLEKWHRSPPPSPDDASQSIQDEDDLEAALLSALLDGRGWSPESKRIERLHQLCVYRCDGLRWARSTEQVQQVMIWDWSRGDVRFMIGFHPVGFDEFHRWIQRFPVGTTFSVTVSPGNAPLTAAEVDKQYPKLGELMRTLKLQIVDVLPYDEFGRCKDSHPDSEKRPF